MATSRLGASLQAVLLLLGVATGLYSQDISALKVAAEDGNAQAQAALGNAFHLGVLLPKDDEEAARWWQQAAKQGDVESEFNLGLAYQLGAGVPRNLTAAAQWYQKAAEQGFASAQQNLGLLYLIRTRRFTSPSRAAIPGKTTPLRARRSLRPGTILSG
ncbi:MAG: tetratricopeptide repeat protein [Candidatus Sulfotelmatobacter sp.]|jgi:hypothetical protein